MARSLAVLALVVFATATVQSCTVTKNSDGTYTATFAPDMTITAYGLENGLSQLNDLLRDCVAGTWNRRCTDKELDEIGDAIERVLRRKERFATPG